MGELAHVFVCVNKYHCHEYMHLQAFVRALGSYKMGAINNLSITSFLF